jgi:integrase
MALSEIMDTPGAKSFLDSMGRNSQQTRHTYSIGLYHFSKMLEKKGYTLESIISALSKNEENVYSTINDYVTYLIDSLKLSNSSIAAYVAGVRSYFGFYDIDIAIRTFKKKVKMPTIEESEEEAIDENDIRRLLSFCTSRRLKVYLLTLASGAPRALEACAIRNMDIDFDKTPTEIHIRKEYAKTKRARTIYVSDEASKAIKDWISFKYRGRKHTETPIKSDQDLVFTTRVITPASPQQMYSKLREDFTRVLALAGLEKRKEGILRRTITLHSFRRFVKTVLSNQVSQDYSEWFLGHKKNTYYATKPAQRAALYKNKCMKYLTFLDYNVLAATGKNIEVKLEEKDTEIETLKTRINNLEKSNTVNFISLLHEKLKARGYVGGEEELVDKLANSQFFTESHTT